MVLHFQDNGETPVSLIRLLWTSGCRKRSGQETQSGCKTKTVMALSKTFILYNFCCCHCFPWEMGGEGPAFTDTAPTDLVPRSCTGQTQPNSAHLWIMESLSCNFMKPLDETLCSGRCSRGKARERWKWQLFLPDLQGFVLNFTCSHHCSRAPATAPGATPIGPRAWGWHREGEEVGWKVHDHVSPPDGVINITKELGKAFLTQVFDTEKSLPHTGQSRETFVLNQFLTHRQGLGCGAKQPFHKDSRDLGELLPFQVH